MPVALLALALTAVSAVGLLFTVARLRRETIPSARAALVAGGTPALTSSAFLILGQPPFHPLVIGVAALLGFGIGVGVAAQARAAVGSASRLTITLFAVWSVAYVLASLSSLAPMADLQAIMAIVLSATAGLSAGAQLYMARGASSVARTEPTLATTAIAAVQSWGVPPPLLAPAVAAPTPLPPSPSVDSPSVDPSEPVHYTHGSARYFLGYSPTAAGIWDRANSARPTAAFPRTTGGLAAAWQRFVTLEPAATPIAYYAGLALGPIAEVDVHFTHIGSRFALGRTPDRYAIWDRWAPGEPVVNFSVDDDGALRAWRQFAAWEPDAVAVSL